MGTRGPGGDGRITRQAQRSPKMPKGVSSANTARHPKAAINGPPITRPRTGAPVMAIWNHPMAWTRWLTG